MLEDYEQFVQCLKRSGDAACGVATVDGAKWNVACVSCTVHELSQICDVSKESASLAPSLTAGATTSSITTRDSLLFVVTDNTRVMTGFMSYDNFKGIQSVDAKPISIQVPLLFQSIRSTLFSDSGCNCTIHVTPVDASKGHQMLTIDIRGALRSQFVIVATPVLDEHRRRVAMSFLLTSLMKSHTLNALTLDKERRAKAEAEEMLGKAQALIASSGGRAPEDLKAGGQQQVPHGAQHKILKPQSLLNPQQKAPPQKRGRGVKIG